MRSTVFALAFLLLAATAFAQITIGDEISSGPIPKEFATTSLAAPAVAAAKDNNGIAVAWVMSNGSANRVYITRIDGSGHGGGITREMPLASAVAQAQQLFPSLAAAPDGNGFIVAWLEIAPSTPAAAQAVFSRIDAATLTPSAPTALFPPPLAISPTLVRTKNGKTWISAGGLVWSQNGALEGPFGGIASATDMTIAKDVPQLVGSHIEQSKDYYTCSPAPGCYVNQGPFKGFCYPSCRNYPLEYAVDFKSLDGAFATATFDFLTDAQPAIGSNGSETAVVWFRGSQSSGGDVVLAHLAGTFDLTHPDSLALFPPDSGQTRPDIASDGQRYVVVWRSNTSPGNHDIVGMVIDNDGKQTPLSIATSSADERDPSVLSLGGGTFLVVYEKIAGGERRIAGRFMTFGRHRATR